MASGKAGTTLGPYRIIEQIGEGGMATVYRAYQPSMDRDVALKILPAHFAKDARFVERFAREARTIARLEHKNILPVYDYGEENGITYLAMRCLDGSSLKEVLSMGNLTFGDVGRIMEQICSALDYAHRQGIIHRDVKPANILVDTEGEAYLMDFGIAKVLEGSAELTATGGVIGTPAYMAPEQSLGLEVDARTDIYALGVILYELVVGRAPYRADTPMAVALAHIYEPLPIPSTVNPKVPLAIEKVILKALAKEPDERFQSANEMADALRQALVGEQVNLRDSTLIGLAVEAATARVQQRTPVDELPETVDAFLSSPDIPPATKKQGIPGWVWGIGIGLAALIVIGGLIAFILTRGGTSDEAVGGGGEIPLHDSFDDPIFDGSFNPDLWTDYQSSNCTISQQDSTFALARADGSPNDGCRLQVRPTILPPFGKELGSVAVRMQISSDQTDHDIGSMFGIATNIGDRLWYATCGFGGWVDGETGIAMEVVYKDPENPLLWVTYPVIEPDRWYDIELRVEPGTMTVTCLLDGDEVGSFTPDNAAELREARFDININAWFNEPGPATRVYIDDFRIGENPAASEAASALADEPTPVPDDAVQIFDDFDDTAFDGSLNPEKWTLGGEDAGEACLAYQQDGVLVMGNADDVPWGDICTANIREFQPGGDDLTSVVFDVQVSSEGYTRGSEFEMHNRFNFALISEDVHFGVNCGPTAYYNDLSIGMSVFEGKGGEDPENTYHSPGYPINFGTNYRIRFEVEPAAMTFTCYVDNQEIGSYTPDNAAELRTLPAMRYFYIERYNGAFARVLVDNLGFYSR